MEIDEWQIIIKMSSIKDKLIQKYKNLVSKKGNLIYCKLGGEYNEKPIQWGGVRPLSGLWDCVF